MDVLQRPPQQVGSRSVDTGTQSHHQEANQIQESTKIQVAILTRLSANTTDLNCQLKDSSLWGVVVVFVFTCHTYLTEFPDMVSPTVGSEIPAIREKRLSRVKGTSAGPLSNDCTNQTATTPGPESATVFIPPYTDLAC